jgi:hypothetical protein
MNEQIKLRAIGNAIKEAGATLEKVDGTHVFLNIKPGSELSKQEAQINLKRFFEREYGLGLKVRILKY